jgi:hypothetical protein
MSVFDHDVREGVDRTRRELERHEQIGVDGDEQVHHLTRDADAIIVIDPETGRREERFELSAVPGKLGGWESHVEQQRGWDDLDHVSLFGGRR